MKPMLSLLFALFFVIPAIGGIYAAHAQSERTFKTLNAAASGKRTALVIGNATYTSASSLRNPLNDARAMSDALRELGFEVTQGTNLNRASLEKAINDWGRGLKNYEVALFYYAGHGMEAEGQNYLMPTDANPQNQSQIKLQACSVEMVTGWMDEARIKTNILLLDACRNNPFARSWSRNNKEGGLANMAAPSGTFVGFAAAPGKTADDGDRANGLYTEAIVKHLLTPNLTIDQIFNRVNQYVRKESGGGQVPFKNSSLEDDFFFAVNGAEPKPETPVLTKKESPKPAVKPVVDLDPFPMVYVEGGTFMMGSENGESNEKPVHQVTVGSFRMATTETTVAQYRQYCEAMNISMPDKASRFSAWRDNNPIINVSWEDAVGYCEWLTRKTGMKYRLPTEAEWEYAARGGKSSNNTIYAGSSSINTVAWHSGNSKNVHPVGEKLPNELGLYDMSGNVWEWCSDWYGADFYTNSSSSNPTGPTTGD